MSTLPPYNPSPGTPLVWILPVLPGDAPALHLLPPTAEPGRVVAQDTDLAHATAGLSAKTVEVSAEPRDIALPTDGWLVGLGTPAWAEGLVRRVMSIPDGVARLVLLPGALTTVQLLPDRAVLLHLNDGRAMG